MKILELHITNFRGVRHAHITPDRPTLLLGLNGQGKSTILQAVGLLLFGGALDARGSRILVADLIGPHGKDAEVRALIETPQGRVIAEARITTKGIKAQFLDERGVGLYSPNAEAARIAFWAACGIDPERAAVACNPRAYLMDGGIGSVLARLDGGGIDSARLRDDCGDHWDFVERLANTHRTGLASVPQLEALGAAAFSERTSTKRLLADAENRARIATESAGGVVYDASAMERAQRTMRECEQQLADLRVTLGRAQQQTEAAQNAPDYEALTAEQANLEQALRGELEGTTAVLAQVQAESKSAQEAHAKAGQLVKGKESALTASARIVAMTEAQIEQLRQRAAVAEKGECPTCGGKMKKADFDAAKKAVTLAENDLAKVQAEHAKAEQALADARAEAEAANQRAVAAMTEASRDAARIELLTRFLDGQDVRGMDDTMHRLVEIARILKAPRPDPVDVTEVEKQIAEVEARIAKGRAIIAQGEAARDAEAHTRDADAYRAEIANLDWVVKAFKDGALTKQYSGAGLDAFVAEASAVLEPYGYGLSVATQGKITNVLLHLPEGGAVPYQWASKGQRVLMEWAVTCIASQAVACVDDLDALSGHFKSIVIPQIAARETGTTLAAATWGVPGTPDVDALSEAMGVSVVWVEQGADGAAEVAA